jgi:Spy/CpxP family protein refolding chaperone
MDSTPSPDSTRRRWFAGLAALGCLGLLSKRAHAQGWRGGQPLDPAEMAHRLDWRIGRLVTDVGGTPQQKDQLVAIATAALVDLKPLREQARAARRQGLDLLAAPTVDRTALEQLRLSQMQLADTSSRRVLQAMADASDVLTPEQRTKAADRLKQRRWRG